MQENKEIKIQDVIAKRKEHSRRVDTKLIRNKKEGQENHILYTL